MMELDQVVHGDCVEALAADPTFRARLVFADPPFNIGYQYDAYQDRRSYKDYVEWTHRWMSACRQALTEDGSFYIAIGDEFVAEIWRIAVHELKLTMRNWIVWHYTFGQNTRAKFSRAHTHILYFVANAKKFVFNDSEIRTPSARQLIYNDSRAHPKGKIPDDVWRYSRVCGTFKERQGWHGCQMPTKLLARIIRASSDVGDVVLDPFCGSGTTAVTAAALGRRYLPFDISTNYVDRARQRLADLHAGVTIDLNDGDDGAAYALPPRKNGVGADGESSLSGQKKHRMTTRRKNGADHE